MSEQGRPQRVADRNEKNVQEAKISNTETWVGPHNSKGLLGISTDSFGDRYKNFCPLQPGTMNQYLFTLNFTSLNYKATEFIIHQYM